MLEYLHQVEVKNAPILVVFTAMWTAHCMFGSI